MSGDNRPIQGLDEKSFLRDTWQKRPCLLPRAIPWLAACIDRETVLRLCTSDDTESRLVIEKDGEYPWQVINGPLDTDDLAALPDSNWTVLVQNMEMHEAVFFDLLQLFSFLPRWRIDDVMISLAADLGGVGPHLDSYDVFLLQISGNRRWYINENDYDESCFIDGLDLRVLEDFQSEKDWLLKPGDMLYLPPGVAHHGVATGEAITCSIGFRAPSRAELLAMAIDENSVTGQQLYTDPAIEPAVDPCHFNSTEAEGLRHFMLQDLGPGSDVQRWLGCHFTRLPDGLESDCPEKQFSIAEIRILQQNKTPLRRNLRSRALYTVYSDRILLFINGDSIEICPDLRHVAHQLCRYRLLSWQDLKADTPGDGVFYLLCDLLNRGFLQVAQ